MHRPRFTKAGNLYLAVIAAATMILVAQVPSASAGKHATMATPAVTAICTALIPLNISPGLFALKRTQGTNQSFGETGTLTCVGSLDGHPVAGPGTVGFAGLYTGTCNSTTGTGLWSFTLPVSVDGGTRVIHHGGPYNSPGVGILINFDGTFETGRLAGVGLVVPVQGDCLTAPLTKATFSLTGLQLTQ